MKLAFVTSQERGEIDRLLSEISEQLQSMGKSLVGIVKVPDYQSSFDNGCDMKVRILPDGPEIQITQNLGAGSDACRLDPRAITEVVSQVEAGSMADADLFILNKFGPEEAAGRGFCNVIGTVLGHGIPVLVGVGGANIDAFETFAGGMAETLAPHAQAVLDWFQGAEPKGSSKAAE